MSQIVKDIPPCGCAAPGLVDASTCYCGVDDLLKVIRRRYSLAVMNAIHSRGTARYHDVATALPQASSSTLAETLLALSVAELISRTNVTDVAGSHAAYTLTVTGTTLLSRLRVLLDDVHSP